MLKSIAPLLAALSLAACNSVPEPRKVAITTDGRVVENSDALKQRFLIDAQICAGEAEKANLSYGASKFGGLAGIAEQEQREAGAMEVAKGCLAQHGYLLVDEPLVADTSRRLSGAKQGR